jgi:hypothetical protein
MFEKYFCGPYDSCVLLKVKTADNRIILHGMGNIKK